MTWLLTYKCCEGGEDDLGIIRKPQVEDARDAPKGPFSFERTKHPPLGNLVKGTSNTRKGKDADNTICRKSPQ